MKSKKIINAVITIVQSLSLDVKLALLGCFLIVMCVFIAGYSFPNLKKTSRNVAVHTEEVQNQSGRIKKVRRNESLYKIFIDHGAHPLEATLVGKALKKFVNPKRIRIGDRYSLAVSTAGMVESFVYMPNRYDKFIVKRVNGVFEASKEKIKIELTIVGVLGKISNSLYESMVIQKVHPEIIVNFAEMFAWDIDFYNDTRNGDAYWVVWENKVTEDGRQFHGRILGGSYKGKITGDDIGIYFEPAGGRGEYFNLDGKSLRRTFLRAPLSYKRISSHFTYRRFHPILRYYRPHTGIDYVAPRGTPVETIGDGTVVDKGWKGQSGKMVKIKHNSVYSTSYSHLSKYAKGIKAGKKVKQGQVVGYVGTTGLSTGPHLHFLFTKFGKPVNFLKLKLPSVGKVKEKDRAAFKAQKRKILLKASEVRFGLNGTVEIVN